MKNNILKMVLAFTITISIIGCGKSNTYSNNTEKSFEQISKKENKKEIIVKEESVNVVYERLPEWDLASDYLRIQIDDVIYRQGSTFGEMWEDIMSSNEDYFITYLLADENGRACGEEEYIYDPNEKEWSNPSNNYAAKCIIGYKQGKRAFQIIVIQKDMDTPISETPVIITGCNKESDKYINGMTINEIQEHRFEDLIEWKRTILSGIEWKYPVDYYHGGADINYMQGHYDSKHKVTLFVTYNRTEDGIFMIDHIGYGVEFDETDIFTETE